MGLIWTTEENEGHHNLGKVTTQVLKELEGFSETMDDPIMRLSGCAGEFGPSIWERVRARVQDIVRAAGFLSYDEFLNEVTDRTNDKWVWESCLGMMDVGE